MKVSKKQRDQIYADQTVKTYQLKTVLGNWGSSYPAGTFTGTCAELFQHMANAFQEDPALLRVIAVCEGEPYLYTVDDEIWWTITSPGWLTQL